MKALQLTLDKIEKSYGKGTIMRMGDGAIEDIPFIPSVPSASTLRLGLEDTLEPRDRNLRSGVFRKTTLALHAIAESQKEGGTAAFIDAEHAFDRLYAEKLGLMWKICWYLNRITESRLWK
jgi:recombination protein RecA